MKTIERAAMLAAAPDWYVVGTLRAMAALVAQGLDDEALLRAWRGYGAGAPGADDLEA